MRTNSISECGMRNSDWVLAFAKAMAWQPEQQSKRFRISAATGGKRRAGFQFGQVSWARKRVAAAVMLYASQVASRRAYAVCRDPNLDAAEDETGSIIFESRRMPASHRAGSNLRLNLVICWRRYSRSQFLRAGRNLGPRRFPFRTQGRHRALHGIRNARSRSWLCPRLVQSGAW
jgi:hypothetical protein